MEQSYEFRQRMLQRHRYDLRLTEKSDSQIEIDESYIIAIAKTADRVIENAALDLQDCLRSESSLKSMICLLIYQV